MSNFSMKVATSIAILGGIVASAVSASAALNLAPQSCSYSFTTNMKLGSRGTSVMDLQKVLNMYPQTLVSESGAGSPGMETTTFGAATKRAVNKFQALHLTELGITAPTGNVFAGTRGILNEVCSGQVSTLPPTGTTFPLGCTSASGFSSLTGQSCATGVVVTTFPLGCTSASGFSSLTGQSCAATTPVTTVTGPVSATLAASQPTGNLISGQAGAILANIVFSGNGTVSSVTLNRGGVSDQSTLTNVYLYDGATRLTDGYTFNNAGTLTMNNVNLAVNGSRTVTVRADILAGSTVTGQTVSVILASFLAGTAATTVNLAGNALSIVNGTGLLATANLTITGASPSAASVNAGAVNQNLWSNTVAVGLHKVDLRGMTVKMIGSAPSNTLANVSLFVDGTKVSTATINGNSQFVFDLSTTPYSMTTGSHTVEIRGDVIGGANRNFYLSLEKASDLMVNDSQVSGGSISVTPTLGGATLSNQLGGLITVSAGTITVNQDTAFNNTTNLVSGATNVKMAAFKFTAYGEDVKVNSLSFKPSFSLTPASTTMINVGLYINGGQVGSNKTVTSGATSTFDSLGSNLIVAVGTPVVVEIRGDVMNDQNVNYTSGTARFDLLAVANNAQGVTSGQLAATSAATGQSLSISSSNISFAQTSGWAGATTSPNQLAKKIGSFTLQTGSAEGVVLSNVLVTLAGDMLTANQLTNLTVKDGSTILGGNAIGSPTASNNISVSLSVDKATTKTFEVYADLGSSAAGYYVVPSMQITYRGATSNVTTTSALKAGATTTAAVATINGVTGVTFVPSSSATAQFVVGGQAVFPIGTFNIKNTGGIGGATVKDVTVWVPSNTIGSVTMNGVTGQVVDNTAILYNVGVVVPADASGVNVPMTVSLNCVGATNGCSGVSSSTVNAVITTLTYNNGSTVVSTSTSATTTSSVLVASKPTIAMTTTSGSGLINGNIKIGEFSISADAAGDIKVGQIAITVASSTNVAISAGTLELRDSTGNTVIVGATGVNGDTGLSASGNFAFTTGGQPTHRTITKGTSETFTVWATFSGITGAANTMSETFGLGAKALFLWDDVVGGVNGITGTQLNTYPSGTQTKNN